MEERECKIAQTPVSRRTNIMPFVRWLQRLFSSASTRHEAHLQRGGETTTDDDFTAEADEEIDLFNPFPEPMQLDITDVLDLHAFAPSDVRRVVEEYLREAHEAGFESVRVIHGKGIGVQRETVRRILARTPFVRHFTDAPAEAGGWGATIVFFERR